MQSTSPLFTNDPIGFLKALSLFLIPTASILTAIFWLAKKGDRDAINKLNEDVNGAGRNHNELKNEVRAGLAKLEGKIDTMNMTMIDGLKETNNLIVALSQQQTKATHEVEKDVVALRAEAKMADCLDRGVDKIIGALKENGK